MINIYLANIVDDDRHREAEKAQLIKIANRLWKDQTRQRLAKLACQIGLTQTR